MKKICNPFKSVKIKNVKKKSKQTKKTKVSNKQVLFKVTLRDDKNNFKKTTVVAPTVNTAIKKALYFYSAPIRSVYKVERIG